MNEETNEEVKVDEVTEGQAVKAEPEKVEEEAAE